MAGRTSLRGRVGAGATSVMEVVLAFARARAPGHPQIGAQVDPALVDAGTLQMNNGPLFFPLSHFMND